MGLSPQAERKLLWIGIGLSVAVAMIVGLWWGSAGGTLRSASDGGGSGSRLRLGVASTV